MFPLFYFSIKEVRANEVLTSSTQSETYYVYIDKETCSGCGICVDADILGYITLDPDDGRAVFYVQGNYYSGLYMDGNSYFLYYNYVAPNCPSLSIYCSSW